METHFEGTYIHKGLIEAVIRIFIDMCPLRKFQKNTLLFLVINILNSNDKIRIGT